MDFSFEKLPLRQIKLNAQNYMIYIEVNVNESSEMNTI